METFKEVKFSAADFEHVFGAYARRYEAERASMAHSPLPLSKGSSTPLPARGGAQSGASGASGALAKVLRAESVKSAAFFLHDDDDDTEFVRFLALSGPFSSASASAHFLLLAK